MNTIKTIMTTKLLITSLLGIALINACTTAAPMPTETIAPTRPPAKPPVPTSTIGPTPTFIRKPTSETANVLSPTPTAEFSPTPVSEWHGLPIMPGAFATISAGDTLSYRVLSEISEVISYYKEEMAALGWSLSGESISEDGNGLFIFIQDDATLTIAIEQLESGGETTVLLILA